MPLRFRFNRRARRYILRVAYDGSACVTIPRGGSTTYARLFAQRHRPWLERQLTRLEQHPDRFQPLGHGSRMLFRGEWVSLAVDPARGLIRFADQAVRYSGPVADLRPPVEAHLRGLAKTELVRRCEELAVAANIGLGRITVRNQRSRWGSCSAKGTISLNWRLVLAPSAVADYLILHELMHRLEMNHSKRFWRLVESACPGYREAELWLKRHDYLLK